MAAIVAARPAMDGAVRKTPTENRLKAKLQNISRALGRVQLLKRQNPSAADAMGRHGTSLGHATLTRKGKRTGSGPEDHAVSHSRRQRSHDSDDTRRHHAKQHARKKFEHIRGKFRVTAKLAIICARLSKAHWLRNKLYDEISPYINSLAFHDYEAQEKVDLMFDPSSFKADKQLRISEEAKTILSKPAYGRTDRELNYRLDKTLKKNYGGRSIVYATLCEDNQLYSAQIVLRNIKSIAEYPMRMQKRITEIGVYQKFDAKRVVVRQGHSASAFYFILSGSVVVMVSDMETKVAKPVAYLYKGMTFGELAIVNRTLRQSTVIAKETLELLSIDIADFHRIFMSGGVKNLNDPDHNEFVRGLSYLRNWPLDRMADNAKKCIFHYYKRGDVLVKDSNYSDWIFIVKSGSLQVLKKLRRAEAVKWKKYKDMKPEVVPASLPPDEQDERAQERRFILSDICIPLRHDPELEFLRRRRTIMRNGYDTNQSDDKRKLSRDYMPSDMSNSWSYAGDEQSKPRDLILNVSPARSPRRIGVSHHPSYSVSRGASHSEHTDSDGVYRSHDKIRLERTFIAREERRGDNYSRIYLNRTQDERMLRFSRSNSSLPAITPAKQDANDMVDLTESVQSKALRLKSKRDKEKAEVEKEMQGRKQQIRTITQDLDAGAYQMESKGPSEADLDPVFVEVQTLTKGQAFGIAEAILGPQPSMCVVSNGAECIMLAKDLYLRHAPEALVRRLKQECCPYPSDEQMQQCLQASVDWEAYRRDTFQDTLHQLKLRKTLQKQALLTCLA